jgi:peptidyl-dipeptidase A
MVRFEMAMYADPDQDLNALWWRLVQRYQGLTPPEGRDKPDYAAKYHVAMAPAYYHNYLLGELMASQLHATIARQIVGEPDVWRVTYVGRPDVGTYLRSRVFAPGALVGWNELVRHATGDNLSPRAFAAQFVHDGAATP